MSSNSFNTEAVILKVMDYGEAHTIATLYTRKLGKLTAFAAHARKSKKRFVGKLDLFSFVNAEFEEPQKKSSLYPLKSTSTDRVFGNIRKDLIKISLVSIVAELFSEMMPENYPNENLFRFFKSYVEDVDQGKINAKIFPVYLVQLLKLSGLGPDFSACNVCSRSDFTKNIFFSYSRSTLLCSKCATREQGFLEKLSASTLQILKKDPGKNLLSRLVVDRKSSREMRTLIRRLCEFHIGKELKGFKFLEELDEKGC